MKRRSEISASSKVKYAENKEAFRAKNAASYVRNKVKILSEAKKYKAAKRRELLAAARAYYAANKDAIRIKKRAYERLRMKNNAQFRFSVRIRHRVRQAIKLRGGRKFYRFLEMCGCTSKRLTEHIEGLFQPGMTWDNFGEWHVDHKTPLALFDLTKPEEQKAAAHFTNLQPLWAADNLKKWAHAA